MERYQLDKIPPDLNTMSRKVEVYEALKCAICLSLLDDHRELSCGHSYCLECLKSCLASKARRRRTSISCPKCKKVTHIPEEGVGSLQRNYDLLAVINAIVESRDRSRGGDEEILQTKSPARGSVAMVAGNDDLQFALMIVQSSTERFQEYLKENKDLIKTIKDSAKKVESDINEHFNMFKDLKLTLDKSRLSVLQDVESIRNKRIKAVDADRASAERTLKSFKECREQLKKVEKMNPSNEEYNAQRQSICREAEALNNNTPPCIDKNLAWMQYVKVMSPDNMPHTRRLRTDRTIELELESEFGKGWLFKLGKARGIAVTSTGALAVAESSYNRVSVWENLRGEYQRKFYLRTPWLIQAMQKPTDVAVTSDGKFVVIDSANTIKIFSATGEYNEKEILKEEGTTCATSDKRLNDGNLILMDSGETISRFNNATGNILLPPIEAGITAHAISTNGNKVAISNCKEVRIFRLETRVELLRFEARVKGLCFDDDTDSILATTFDRKICQYCVETGQFLAVVSPDCLYDPWGLVIVPGRKLAVADDQSVKVYNIKDNF